MRKLAALFFIMPLCLVGLVFGQNTTISGTITSAKDNEALPGATVVVKGTTIGTVTDVDGKYVLSVPQGSTSLDFSFIGYRTTTEAIGGRTTINVSLEEDVLGLEEVVVTAIGISSEKKALGYSVQDVKGDELVRGGATDALNGLSGKVAGLQVIQSAGTPGAAVNIRLRGATSVTGNNQPLFVVDGVPIDNSQTNTGNPDDLDNNLLGNVNLSNRAVDINPDDIESITVLKGPAATALYGINAANGAIVITTKKGQARVGGGVNVTYSTGYTWDKVSQLPELQDQYVKGSGGIAASYESGTSGSWGASKDTLFWDPDLATPFNQNGQLVGASSKGPNAIPFTPFDNLGTFFQTGTAYENSLSLSGGNNDASYIFSLSTLNQDGIVPLSSFDRYTARFGGSVDLGTKWKTSGSVTYSKSGGTRIQQGSNISGLMLDLLRTPISFDNSNGATDPTDPSAYIFEDGTQRNYRGGGGYDNPYWTINQSPYVDDVNRIYGYTQLDYQATSWLSFTYRLGGDLYNDRRKQQFAINSRAFPDGRIFQQDIFHRQFNSDILATLTKDFNDKLSGSLTLGNNEFAQYHQELFVEGNNLNFPDFFNLSVASDILTRESVTRYRTLANYAAGELAWNETLYLNLTGRQEKSSTLPEGNNSFFYPSASLAWVFTESLGLTNNKVLPFGKIRLSYAQVGKDAPVYATSNYYDQPALNDGWTTGVAFPLPIGGTNVVSFSNYYILGNEDLKPETTTTLEVGTELRFLSNRASLDVTYYDSDSKDLILASPIPGSSGWQYQIKNVGEITNNGFEIAVGGTPIRTSSFSWDISVNWSKNNSEVVSLGDSTIKNVFLGGFEGSAIYAVVGEEYGTIYGSHWIRDANGNVVIGDAESGQEGYPIPDDQTGPVGNVNPDWIAGIINTFSYKGLSLTALFDIRQGGDIWNGTRGAITFFGMSAASANRFDDSTYVFNTGVYEGSVTGHIDDDGNLVTGGANNTAVPLDQAWYQGLGSDFGGGATEAFVEDGSYVKLRELTLTYSFPQKVMAKTPFAGIDISAVGRNLWLKTDYLGVDPETSLTGATNSQGMDYFNMPNTKSFGVNVKVTL